MMSFSEIKQTFSNWMHSAVVRQFASGSCWMTAARCLWILAAFTVGIAVARKLGPHDYGLVNYAVAYAGMFSVIASLGVDGIVERDYILHPENRNAILGNYFLFKLITTTAMLAAFAFSCFFISDRKIMIFCCIAACGYIFFPLNATMIVFSATLKNEYNAFSQIITCVVYNAVRLWAALTVRSLEVYLCAEALLVGLPPVLFFFFYTVKCGNPLQWRFSLRGACALFVPAIPLSITMLLGTIYARTDLLMLEHYMGPEAVGCYTIASRFTENWYLFISMFSVIFSVAVINGFKASAEEYRKQLHRYYFMLFYMTLPPIALSLIFGRFIIAILYGKSYLPAVPVFYVCVLTMVCSALLNGFSTHAINENRLKTIAAVFLSGVVINIPLNAICIQCFGIWGAALSSLVSMPLGFTGVLFCSQKGREDLRFILYSITHLPSFKLNQTKDKN